MTDTRIVVGVDGSEAAHVALRWAVALGETFGAEVVAVHAVGLLEEIHDPEETPTTQRRSVAALVEEIWCAGLEQAECPHRVLVREGPPVDLLLGTVHDERASLLVVGRRGAGATNPALELGSTSLRVLQSAPVPVLVVPDGSPGAPGGGRLRRLLVGVDRSDSSLAALDLAADVAGATGAALTVAEVIEYVPPFPLGPATADTLRGEENALERTGAVLEAKARAIRERGIATQVVVRSGEPESALLEIAADVDADLVVVGSRGHGDPARPLLGSVARSVVHRARRPTLVVPAAAGEAHLRPAAEQAADDRDARFSRAGEGR
jgi:nucleotide-binding universal stress UspA family protein